MKFRIFKHVKKFVAKNDQGVAIDFPGGPHVRMRLFVRVLPFFYRKTDITFMQNIKCKLYASDFQNMVSLYYARKRIK